MIDQEALRKVLTEEMVDDFDGGHMVGDYIVIAEVFDKDGDAYLVSRSSKDITFWKEYGMLEARRDSVRVRSEGSEEA